MLYNVVDSLSAGGADLNQLFEQLSLTVDEHAHRTPGLYDDRDDNDAAETAGQARLLARLARQTSSSRPRGCVGNGL